MVQTCERDGDEEREGCLKEAKTEQEAEGWEEVDRTGSKGRTNLKKLYSF